MVELKRDSKAISPIWIITVTDKEGFHKQLNITNDERKQLCKLLMIEDFYDTLLS